MHRLWNILRTAAVVLAMASLAVGCLQEDESTDIQTIQGHENDCMVSLNVALPMTTYSTRALAMEYDPGTAEWENYVEIIGDLRIYFFDSSNRFIGMLSKDDMRAIPHKVEGTSDYRYYTVRGWISNPPQGVFKVMVLANCGVNSYPEVVGGKLKMGSTEVVTIDEICERLVYNIGNAPVTQLDWDHRIPMFAISDLLSDKVFAQGELTELGDLYLLRALAKIEVCVNADEVADLEYVKLHNYNRAGLCAPLKVYTKSEYVHGHNIQQDYLRHVSIPSNPQTQLSTWDLADNGKAITYQTSDTTSVDRKIFTIYVPEYRNLVQDASGMPTSTMVENPSYLSLKFTDEQSRVYNLYFKDYDTNTPFDIQRNNYYRYTVNRIDTDLHVDATVVPYVGVDLNPSFGITAPYIDASKSSINLFPGAIYENFDVTVKFYTLRGDDEIRFEIENTAIARIDGTPAYGYDEQGWRTASVRIISQSNVLTEAQGQTMLNITCGPLSKSIPIINGPERVSLNRYTLDMLVGWTRKLKASIFASNLQSDGVTWETTNPSVATVDPDGNVTAVSDGTCVVRARFVRAGSGGTSSVLVAECAVTVGPPRVYFYSYESEIATLGECQFIAKVWPEEYQTSALQWSSGNTAVATVTQGGLVQTLRNGLATITVSYRDLTASVPVSVSKAVLSLNYSSVILAVDKTVTLRASVSPTGRNLTIKWRTSNASLATVTNGEVKRLATGAVTITAYAEEDSTIKAQCVIN